MLGGVFNNRELATGFWLGLLLVWAVTHRSVREAGSRVLRAFWHWKVALPCLLMVGYVIAVTWVLTAVGMWKPSLIKETIIWFVLSGGTLLFDYVPNRGAGRLGRAVLDNLKVVVLVEFLVATYTFSLPAELVLIPSVTAVALLGVVAERDPKFRHIAGGLNSLQIAIGLGILSVAVVKALKDFSAIGNLDSVRELLLAPILSVLLVPFVYGVGVAASYEDTLLRIRTEGGTKHSAKLSAWWQVYRHLGLSVRRLEGFRRFAAAALFRVKTRTDLDQLLDEWHHHQASRKRDASEVEEREGSSRGQNVDTR